MKNTIKIIVLGLAAATLVGCATGQNYANAVNSWIGSSTRALFATWGYPNQKMKLQNGNTLYVYKDEEKGEIPPTMFPGYSTVRSSNGQTVVTSTPPIFTGGTRYDLKCDTWFEINKRSRIVGASFRGNDCVGGKGFVKHYSNPNAMANKVGVKSKSTHK